MSLPKVVIIGGGFGGLQAAKGLRRSPLQVTLIDRSNHHLFQPLLYQVATAGLSPADISMPIRSILRHQENCDVLMAEVQTIDAERKVIISDRGEIAYDYLIVATGARHAYFGHNDWEKYAPGLKSVDDATYIRRRILLAFERAEMETAAACRTSLLTFVLVGGGPTGVEMAGAIAELATRALASDFRHIRPNEARVVLVEAGPRLLTSFPEHLSLRAAADLRRLGVEVRCDSRVEKVDANGVDLTVVGKGSERIASQTVIWAAGVVATLPGGNWLSGSAEHEIVRDSAGRVQVMPDLTVPGHTEIYVIGDAARIVEANGALVPGVCPAALQQGDFVAKLIHRRVTATAEEPISARPVFRYWNKGNLATIGRSSAIADFGKLTLSGFIAWFAWLAVHIFFLIGFRNRFLVLFQWAWAYVTFQRGARLITPVARTNLP